MFCFQLLKCENHGLHDKLMSPIGLWTAASLLPPEVTIFEGKGGAATDVHCYTSILIGSDSEPEDTPW